MATTARTGALDKLSQSGHQASASGAPLLSPLISLTDRLVHMAEFIYQMTKVRKAHGDKVVLDNVSLN